MSLMCGNRCSEGRFLVWYPYFVSFIYPVLSAWFLYSSVSVELINIPVALFNIYKNMYAGFEFISWKILNYSGSFVRFVSYNIVHSKQNIQLFCFKLLQDWLNFNEKFKTILNHHACLFLYP